MWRIALTLLAHRFLLFGVGWGALHFSGVNEKQIPVLLTEDLLSQAAIFIAPYLNISPELGIVVISNVLFFLFLWQLYSYANQLALPEVAGNTCVLVILWVASYELSLGSPLIVSCLLLTLVLNFSNNGQWLLAAIFLGLLASQSYLAALILPFLIFSLWGQNRYAPPTVLVRKGIYLALALGSSIFFNRNLWLGLPSAISNSVFWSLNSFFKMESFGPSFSVIFFGIGAICSLFIFTSYLHRLLVLLLFFGLCLVTPFESIGSQVLLISPVLIGMAEVFPSSILKMTQVVLLILGCIEIFNLFQ